MGVEGSWAHFVHDTGLFMMKWLCVKEIVECKLNTTIIAIEGVIIFAVKYICFLTCIISYVINCHLSVPCLNKRVASDWQLATKHGTLSYEFTHFVSLKLMK